MFRQLSDSWERQGYPIFPLFPQASIVSEAWPVRWELCGRAEEQPGFLESKEKWTHLCVQSRLAASFWFHTLSIFRAKKPTGGGTSHRWAHVSVSLAGTWRQDLKQIPLEMWFSFSEDQVWIHLLLLSIDLRGLFLSTGGQAHVTHHREL